MMVATAYDISTDCALIYSDSFELNTSQSQGNLTYRRSLRDGRPCGVTVKDFRQNIKSNEVIKRIAIFLGVGELAINRAIQSALSEEWA